jgi:hypothetical protein
MRFSEFYRRAVEEQTKWGQVTLDEELFGAEISDALDQLWGGRGVVIEWAVLEPPPEKALQLLQPMTLFQSLPSSVTPKWPSSLSNLFQWPLQERPSLLSIRQISTTSKEMQFHVALKPPMLEVRGSSLKRNAFARFWADENGSLRFGMYLELPGDTVDTLVANFAQLGVFRDLNVAYADLVVTNNKASELFPKPVGLACEVVLPPNLAHFFGRDRLMLCGSLTYLSFWQPVDPWLDDDDPEGQCEVHAAAVNSMELEPVEKEPVEEELEAWLVNVKHASSQAVRLAGNNEVLRLHDLWLHLEDRYVEETGVPLPQAVLTGDLRLVDTQVRMLAHLTHDRALLTFRSLRDNPDKALLRVLDAGLLDRLLHGNDWRHLVWSPDAYNDLELIDVKLLYHLQHRALAQSVLTVKLPGAHPIARGCVKLELEQMMVTLTASFPTVQAKRDLCVSCEAALVLDGDIVFDAVVDFFEQPHTLGYLEPGKVPVGRLAKSSLLSGQDLRALHEAHDEFFLRVLKGGVVFRARASTRDDVPDAAIEIPF